MNEYLLVKLLHLVGFAYWLGGDLGVFISSFFVVNDKLSKETRINAAKILFSVDLGPRISMTMMLPLGVHLAWTLGVLPLSTAVMTLVWLVSFAWLGMVTTLHSAAPSRFKTALTNIDFGFRLILSVGLAGAGLYSLLGPGEIVYWVALKLAIFGGLVGCGLIIRVKLKPFTEAFGKLVGDNATDADNAAIRKYLGATRPFVVTIWIGLLASAALGIHLF